MLPVAMLLACGGGGGGGTSDQPQSAVLFPTVVSDTFPAGERVDLAGAGYFPFARGDRWEYEAVDGYGLLTDRSVSAMTVEILSGPDAQGTFVVETNTDGAVQQDRYRFGPDGLVNLQPLADVLTPSAAAIVGPLLSVATPMTPVGQPRTSVRKGAWGVDIDGDGIADGFELTYRQTFGGYGDLGFGAELLSAHVHSETTLTAVPSRAGYVGSSTTLEQHSWYVPQLGLVKQTYAPTAQTPAQGWQLRSAFVGGRKVPQDPGLPIRLVPAHRDQTFDALRQRYLIAHPGDTSGSPNLVAIDAASGNTTIAKTFADDPMSLAISSDGGSLYVGLLQSRAVVRLRLSDLEELGRVTMPNGQWPRRLIASPTDSETVVVMLSPSGTTANLSDFGDASGFVLLRGLEVRGDVQAIAGPATFSVDGNNLLVGQTNSSRTLVRLVVSDAGLTRSGETDVTSNAWSWNSFSAWDDKLFIGNAVHASATLQQVGSFSGTRGPCWPVARARRVLCLLDPGQSDVAAAFGVFDMDTLQQVERVEYALRYAPTEIVSPRLLVTSGAVGQMLVGNIGMRPDPFQGNVPRSEVLFVRSAKAP